MTDDDARIDPRYDPAFQRGFDGEVVSGPRSRNAAVRRPSVVSPAPFRPPADAVPDGDEPGDLDEAPVTRSALAASTTSSAVSAPGAAGVADALDDDPEYDRDARRAARVARLGALVRNPFVVVLVVLAIGLIVGGIAWHQTARDLVAAGVSTELDYWMLQTSVTGAPIVGAAGAVVLAGVLALLARAWDRR